MRKLSLLSTILIGSLALPLLAPSTAHASDLVLETGAFFGGHLFSDRNRLGRRMNASDDNVLKHSGQLGFRFGFVFHPRVSLEAELALSPTETKNGQASVLAFGYRAHLLVNILTGRVRPFVLAGAGGFTSSTSNSDVLVQGTRQEVHVGAGLMVDIGCQWGLRLDGRAQFGPSTKGLFFTTDGEINLSLYGRFGKSMTEKCKPAPAPTPAPAAAAAAKPAPPADPDSDGVVGAADACPDKAGPAENKGCPDTDGDNDGVVDRLDQCADKAGPSDNKGCPDTDGDSDGVVDRLDRCADKSGPSDNQGCPWPDGDNDGIADRLDKCPDKAETKNGFEDNDGCPDELPQAMKQFSGKIAGIAFAPAKAVLLPSSTKVLDQAAKTLVEFPTIALEIQGHTDNGGVREKNVELSTARAEAVKAYLVAHGVAATRLTVKGYGPDQPIADNKTAKGKAANRRVEFKLVSTP